MNDVYGVLINEIHHDISLSLKGAKRYATINGFGIVSVRIKSGYNVLPLFKKEGKKWIKIK